MTPLAATRIARGQVGIADSNRRSADAANGLTCIVTDGDARNDLTEKHAVNAYPTGILLDADGREIARYVGYRGVKETTAFLKRRRP